MTPTSNVGRALLGAAVLLLAGCTSTTAAQAPAAPGLVGGMPSATAVPAEVAGTLHGPAPRPTFEVPPSLGPEPTALPDAENVRPDVQPDARTVYLTRGGLPAPLVSEAKIPVEAQLVAEIVCQGVGSFRLAVDSAGTALTDPPAVPCGPDADGPATTVSLGRVEAGSTVAFRFAGSDGVLFLVRVQADRAL